MVHCKPGDECVVMFWDRLISIINVYEAMLQPFRYGSLDSSEKNLVFSEETWCS